MTLMLSKTYDALRSADGVSDQEARDAAEELAAFEKHMHTIDTRSNVLMFLVGLNMVLTLFLFGLVLTR
jgi:hypothetical protein